MDGSQEPNGCSADGQALHEGIKGRGNETAQNLRWQQADIYGRDGGLADSPTLVTGLVYFTRLGTSYFFYCTRESREGGESIDKLQPTIPMHTKRRRQLTSLDFSGGAIDTVLYCTGQDNSTFSYLAARFEGLSGLHTGEAAPASVV